MKLDNTMRVKMRQRIVLSIVLTIMFSVPTFVIPSTFVNAEDAWVQISCFTENSVPLSHLGLSFTVRENNFIFLVGSVGFEAIGNQPILRILIDSSGGAPSILFGQITSDVAFFWVNGSRNLYKGPYSETFLVNATVENGRVAYEIDFTNNVEKAKNAILPKGTIEDFGIIGTMSIEVMIGNSVAVIRQKRFFKVLLQANADLYSIACDITFPQTADIKDAKKGDQDMRKSSSYEVYTVVGVTPFEPPEANLYLEWDMPEEVTLITRVLCHPLFTLIFGSILGSIFGRYALFRMSERRQKKQFAKKLIMELRGIERAISEHRPITTTIYNSSKRELLLFSDTTAQIVIEAYEEIERTCNIGFPLKVGFETENDEVKQLLENIANAIDALRRE